MRVRVTVWAEFDVPDGTDLSKAYPNAIMDVMKDDSGALLVPSFSNDDGTIEVVEDK